MAAVPGVIQQNNPFAGGVSGGGSMSFGSIAPVAAATPNPAAAPNPYAAPANPMAMARKGTGNKGKGNQGRGPNRPATQRTPTGSNFRPSDNYGAKGKGKKRDTGAYDKAKGEHAANQNPQKYFQYLMSSGGVGRGANAGDKFNQWLNETGFAETQEGWDNAQGNNGELGYADYLNRQYGVPKNTKLYGKAKRKGKAPAGVQNPQRLNTLINSMRQTYQEAGGGASTNPATAVQYGRYSAFG